LFSHSLFLSLPLPGRAFSGLRKISLPLSLSLSLPPSPLPQEEAWDL
jgi:hypothetical protein